MKKKMELYDPLLLQTLYKIETNNLKKYFVPILIFVQN